MILQTNFYSPLMPVVLHGDIRAEKTTNLDENTQSCCLFNPTNTRSYFIKVLDGRTIALPFDPMSKISNYSKSIELKVDIPYNQQRLIYAGKQLNKECTLLDYGISPNSTLHLVSRLLGGGFKITVDCNGQGRDITIFVEPDETVYELKEKIEKQIKILAEEQQLCTTGSRGKTLDDNSNTLSDYHIHEGSRIFLGLPVKANGTKSFQTVIIKNAIQEVIQKGWDIKPGLNLRRECKNSDCISSDRPIWVAKEFGTCKIQIEARLHQCPECKKKTKITNFGFFDCVYSVEGKYKSPHGTVVKLEPIQSYTPEGELYVCEDTNIVVNYFYLHIKTMHLNPKTQLLPNEDISTSNFCCDCLSCCNLF